MDEIWQKIFELAVQNTLGHNKRVEVLAELYIKNIGDKDPVEALKTLREFKKEQDLCLEKLSSFSPKTFFKNPIPEAIIPTPKPPPKPLATRLAETSKEKLTELKDILDKIIKY